MNTADRIQHLRKSKGISQEELADKIDVSRQTISKWESEQSSPDIEKIILMSELFEVTTDYLLKGIEPIPAESVGTKEKPNANIFTIVGTAFNFMGIIVAAMTWYEEQNVAATAVGLIFLVIGCMIYGIGMTISEEKTKERAKQLFWTINSWILVFIPLSIVYNILIGAKGVAPYPILVGYVMKYILFWIIYIGIGMACTLIIYKKRAKKNGKSKIL